MKVALLETIEALVSAIKSKFLTKTEAESTYQPKATAINTGNIGSQSVNYASSAYSANKAASADSLTSDYFNTPTGRSLYYISRYSKDLPAESAVIHMGAYTHENCTHEVAFCNDGALYTRYMSNGTWQPWTRMAKASELPDVSGYATEDWVTSNYYDINEIGDIFLPKSGGTMTGNLALNNSSLIIGSRIYESKVSDSNLVFQTYMQGSTKKVYQFGHAADILSFGNGFAEMRADYFFQKGQIRAEKGVKIGNVVLEFNSSTNTLNIKGASGQTVHIAVNGKVIA